MLIFQVEAVLLGSFHGDLIAGHVGEASARLARITPRLLPRIRILLKFHHLIDTPSYLNK